tara:strand:+ start:189 stop:341 length:153 start_codon:yes stop_codon:yes gene_type:complete
MLEHNNMLELIIADGFLMIPLLVCSVFTAGIIAKHFWSQLTSHILPPKVS